MAAEPSDTLQDEDSTRSAASNTLQREIPSPNRMIMLLLQPPCKWTSEQLELARVNAEHCIPSTEFLEGSDDLPDDLFESLAIPFCEVKRATLLGHNYYRTTFRAVFFSLRDIAQTSDYDISPFFLGYLMDKVIEVCRSSLRLVFASKPKIPFKLPLLSRRPGIKCAGSITQRRIKGYCSTPLVLFSVVKKPCYKRDTTIARYEVPQCLIQAVRAYSRNPYLNAYTAFVVVLNGTRAHVSRATFSRAYIHGLYEAYSVNEEMQLSRSESFELLDQDGRREFMRLLIGVLRYVARSRQSMVAPPGEKEVCKRTEAVREERAMFEVPKRLAEKAL
ncbi:hypothetical protein AJ79_00017 [Helicocarpus griseus UAMH5409]|uniref:Uncharacterized protein n=1 Tax=Helicocarpus griseus UAMH5409 TaxID=1447875 RepID=A0A2B7Y4E2_9EURO|nr:hypothetical protein AJ79_00017 [Helicocarpus griseus UAMH5409]